jgi:imidazolonepropionase-like amidohydrolase
MHRFITAAGAAAFAFTVSLAGSLAAHAQTVAYTGARLIVGDGTVVENGTLVVEAGKIKEAGRIAVPAGATRVDLTGKTVMPTMLDTHVHLSPTKDGAIQDMKARAYWGVSAAQSLGLDTPEVFAMRGGPVAGYGRIFSAGRGITRPEPGRTDAPYWINTAEEGRKAVDEQAARKVDIIKIWVDDRARKYPKLTPEIYGPIIDEAHKQGLRVIAHVFDLSDTKGLLKAGVDAFAHNTRDQKVDDEAIALFKAHPNVVLGANMGARGVKEDYAWLKDSLPPAEYAKLEETNVDNPAQQKQWAIEAYNLKTLVDNGVTLVLGTDGDVPWGPHGEIADEVSAGLTPMQVLVAATGNAAAFLKVTDAGTLKAGKSADFIVLDANPLDDIHNTRKISAVYLRGTAVDRAAIKAATH